jgi:hypothetical protein
MNSLDELELDEVSEIFTTEETEEERKERFKIKDLSSLNWALRKLSALEKSHDEDTDLRNEEMHRIMNWFTKQDAIYQGSRAFLEGLVKEYAEEQRAIDPKWRQKCPYGLVSFRKQQPKWDYGDEEVLANLLYTNGMEKFVKTVKTPIKTELKLALGVVDGQAVYMETGEVIPGITVTEREELVTIKLEG